MFRGNDMSNDKIQQNEAAIDKNKDGVEANKKDITALAPAPDDDGLPEDPCPGGGGLTSDGSTCAHPCPGGGFSNPDGWGCVHEDHL